MFHWSMLSKMMITTLIVTSLPAAGQPQDVEWTDYTRHSSSLTFVTSGLAIIDNCAEPLVFQETSENGLRVLEIICREEENGSMARLTFYESNSDPVWLTPWKIELIP